MANVIINDTNLYNIADAIREKTGEEDATFKPSEMAEAILAIEAGGGIEPTDEELTYDIGNNMPFKQGQNAWVVRDFGNRIKFIGYTSGGGIFSNYPYEKFDVSPTWDLSSTSNKYVYLGALLSRAENLKKITGSIQFITGDVTFETRSLSQMFYECYRLRKINDEFIDTSKFIWSKSTGSANCRFDGIFYGCYSLREVPEFIFKLLNSNGTAQPGINGAAYAYQQLFYKCYALNKIENLPVVSGLNNGNGITTNMFGNAFDKCGNLSKLTFQTNPDGTPLTAKWTKQTIDLDKAFYYVGTENSNFTNYNSGLLTENKVNSSNYTTAQFYSTEEGLNTYYPGGYFYIKYGHTEAVETINSLPDTSAAGGGNTIKFLSYQGTYTDYLKGRTDDNTFDSSIEKLTEAEIAVATAKGWTVSLT